MQTPPYIPKACYNKESAGLLTYSGSHTFPAIVPVVKELCERCKRSLQQRCLFRIFT